MASTNHADAYRHGSVDKALENLIHDTRPLRQTPALRNDNSDIIIVLAKNRPYHINISITDLEEVDASNVSIVCIY